MSTPLTTSPPLVSVAPSRVPAAAVAPARNYAVDFFRAIGAFSVVTLHMHYDGLPKSIADSIFLFGRWAVPFFFMVSGYFFEKGSKNNLDADFIKTLKYLINIFVVTNVIYFFIALKTEFYSLTDILSIKTILLGDYIHLWFIGAIIFAYTVLWFILSTKLSKWMPAIAGLLLLLTLLADPYASFTKINIDGYLPRFLLSIPFLFLGFLYSKYQLETKVGALAGALLALLGLALQYIESDFIAAKAAGSHEFFMGTFLFAIGLFALALSIEMKRENLLAEIGRKYSLLIYLYHPLLVVIIFFIIKKIHWQDKLYIIWFNPFSVFLATLLIIKFIEKNHPKVFQVISGRI